MRVYHICFSLIVFFFVFASLSAQNTDNSNAKKDSLLNIITNIDSRLKKISAKDTTKGFSAPLKIDTAYINQLQEMNLQPIRTKNGLLPFSYSWTPFDDNVSFRDTIIFDPAFLPVVFDGKILPSDIDFRSKKLSAKNIKPFYLISADSTFAGRLERAKQVQQLRRQYYMSNPLEIKLNALEFKGVPVVTEEVITQKNPFTELITAGNPIEVSKPEIEKSTIGKVSWILTKNGEHRLQASYNTFSDKWGGDNNFDLFSHQKFMFNFRRKKFSINNLLEWRLQLKQLTSVEDKEKEENKNKGKVNIVEDYLRTYSTFSIDAFKKWSYSSNLEMKTPVLTKRATNKDRTLQREFLSPFELNLGVGMRYSNEIKTKNNRRFNISADLSVLSLNYKYVSSDSIPVEWFGIEKGDKSKTDYGSTYNVNFTYTHNKYTKFNSRIKYFTNYEKVYLEWENTLDFTLNRYFATTLYLYVKYDDGIPKENRDKKWGYFNYNQMFRFGLTYTW